MISLLFGSNKILLYGIIALMGCGVIGASYKYVTDMQNRISGLAADNATLQANELQLEQSLSEQQVTIAGLQANIAEQQAILRETTVKFANERDRVNRLQQRLSVHEIGFLASQRPGLTQGIINNATKDVGRCFEIASGSPLTEQEIRATLPSQINSECPDIANPLYVEETQ